VCLPLVDKVEDMENKHFFILHYFLSLSFVPPKQEEDEKKGGERRKEKGGNKSNTVRWF